MAGGDSTVEEDSAEPVPLSALQHAVYCLRQAALIHVERMWADNRFTAEGHVMHAVADEGGGRRVRGTRRVMSVPLASRVLNLTGVADVVEFLSDGDRDDEGETAFPVEFKRGKPKLHRADEVQLCAQALCLEEMTGRPVPEGALFYGETRRRVVVPFDDTLRRMTRETIAALAEVLATGRTPPPTVHRQRCRACSLLALCRPDTFAKPVRTWRRRMVEASLAEPVRE